MPQIRNSENEALLAGTFTTRNEFMQDGARLVSAVLATNRQMGGQLVEGWLADSRQAHGEASPVWTTANISAADYGAASLPDEYGGPYVSLDGSSEYYSIADAAWQEAGTSQIFTWRWVLITSLAADQTIIGKWDATGGNWRSWKLWYSTTAGAFRFTTNATGLVAADVHVTSTYAEAISTWYFVGGFFKASTQMSVYVGAATDATLTVDDLLVGVSASVFDGGAALTMGASGDPTHYLGGRIGVGNTRFVTGAATYIDAYAARLFHLTRQFYMT